jgi:hypothetical protein
MEITYLKKCILDKQLPKGVILSGDEILLTMYLDKIKENFKIKKLDSINDLLNIRYSKLKLISEDTVYIINEDEVFKSNSNLWNIDLTNIVFIYSSLKKSEKFYKAFEPNIVMFDKLSNDMIKGLLKNRISLSDENIDWIMKECNYDYYKCLNEISKINIFDKELHNKLFIKFKQEGVLCKTDYNQAFAFADAICDRNKILALELLSKVNKYEILKEFTGIYNKLRLQLLVSTHNSSSKDMEIRAKELGISKGMYYVLTKKKAYSVEELCRCLVAISEYINKIKLGMLDSLDAINLFILRYM